jgi:hypothetical protein
MFIYHFLRPDIILFSFMAYVVSPFLKPLALLDAISSRYYIVCNTKPLRRSGKKGSFQFHHFPFHNFNDSFDPLSLSSGKKVRRRAATSQQNTITSRAFSRVFMLSYSKKIPKLPSNTEKRGVFCLRGKRNGGGGFFARGDTNIFFERKILATRVVWPRKRRKVFIRRHCFSRWHQRCSGVPLSLVKRRS